MSSYRMIEIPIMRVRSTCFLTEIRGDITTTAFRNASRCCSGLLFTPPAKCAGVMNTQSGMKCEGSACLGTWPLLWLCVGIVCTRLEIECALFIRSSKSSWKGVGQEWQSQMPFGIAKPILLRAKCHGRAMTGSHRRSLSKERRTIVRSLARPEEVDEWISIPDFRNCDKCQEETGIRHFRIRIEAT